MASKKRSLAKSFTWRIVAILVSFVVAFVMTGSVVLAASFSFLANLINFILYYVHERVWLKINWGKD